MDNRGANSMTKMSDREPLKALGYEEDYPQKYSNSVEATVQPFKKRAHQSANY